MFPNFSAFKGEAHQLQAGERLCLDFTFAHLKGLEDIERERGWPQRTAKVVLQLGLERLARHFGYAGETRGRARAPLRTWLAEDAGFAVE